MRQLSRIIVHCSATAPSSDIGVAEMRDWHTARGWSDVGYNYVIRRDGCAEEGRPLEKPGAHTLGHNKDSIGICLVGGVNEAGRPDCNFTAAQWETLRALVMRLGRRYGIKTVAGHRDYTDTKECPCFDVKAWAQGVLG